MNPEDPKWKKIDEEAPEKPVNEKFEDDVEDDFVPSAHKCDWVAVDKI